MLRVLAVGGVLALAACAPNPESQIPDTSGLYRVEGDSVTCAGASIRDEKPDNGPPFTSITCGWECLRFDGQPTRYLFLDFTRDAPGGGWRLTSVSTEHSRIEECGPIN